GAGKYDFETIMVHELGHASGLAHSGDTSSVMYAFLAPGATRRLVTAQDLSVLDSDGGTKPEPLTAAPWRNWQAIGSTQANAAGSLPSDGTLLKTPGTASDLSPTLWYGIQSGSADSLLLRSQENGNEPG